MRFLITPALALLAACGTAAAETSTPLLVNVHTLVEYGGRLGDLRLCSPDGSCGKEAEGSCVIGKKDAEGQQQLQTVISALSDKTPATVERFKVSFAAFKRVEKGNCTLDLEGIDKVERLGGSFR